jgi:hypothetical protein
MPPAIRKWRKLKKPSQGDVGILRDVIQPKNRKMAVIL